MGFWSYCLMSDSSHFSMCGFLDSSSIFFYPLLPLGLGFSGFLGLVLLSFCIFFLLLSWAWCFFLLSASGPSGLSASGPSGILPMQFLFSSLLSSFFFLE